MSKTLLLLITFLTVSFTFNLPSTSFLPSLSSSFSDSQTQCQKFIQKFIDDIMQQKFMSLPLPTIIYSGITTNNPGQYKQCFDANYQYFLIKIHENKTIQNNITILSQTYTSACMPKQCNTTDIQIALKPFINCTVYDYNINQQNKYNWISILGIVIFSIWSILLIGLSCLQSFKQDKIKYKNQQTHNNNNNNDRAQKQRTSINAQASQPLLQSVVQVTPQYKLFNFYQGYQQLFIKNTKKSILSPIVFITSLGYLYGIQFSYRQTISQNQNTTALQSLYSVGGVLLCNTQIILNVLMFIFGLRLAYNAYKINNMKDIGRFLFDQVLKKWVLLILMTLFVYTYLNVLTSQPLNKIWNMNNGQDCPSTIWQIWFLFKNMTLDCKKCLPWMSIFTNQIFYIILSLPFIIIYKTNKKLGNGLFSLIIINSMLISYAILDSKNIIYQPAKLMNGQIQYVYQYQNNTFVRMGAFYFGLMFGLFMIQGLQKSQNYRPLQSDIAKKVRRNSTLQIILQLSGTALMLLNFLLIIPYLNPSNKDKKPYAYLIFCPFFFIVGLALQILPSFWQGQSKAIKITNKILGWQKWIHLDRMSITWLMIGPMIIGFTTYGMQSSIYYDFITVSTYGIGDLVLAYLFTLVIASSIQCQLNIISAWAQYKIYGKENKYSVLVIQGD